MSRRLQVLIPDHEMAEIEKLAKGQKTTVGAWVRQALREARAAKPSADAATKLKAIRRAAEFSFPAGDIDQMLSEIERGYFE